VDVAHRGKPRVQRDAELARTAHVLIMIYPCAGDRPQMRQPARHATEADRTGIWRQPVYIGNREDRLPPGKSVRARPAGLPGLGKRR
jgi:hypothetical protein